jgi:hypothetical protein
LKSEEHYYYTDITGFGDSSFSPEIDRTSGQQRLQRGFMDAEEDILLDLLAVRLLLSLLWSLG